MPDAAKWEIIVARNGQEGEWWRRKLWTHNGILIQANDVFLTHRLDKIEGARFTKVYLTPRVAQVGTVRGVLELAEFLVTLQRTCLRGGQAFEGFYTISESGEIYGPAQTL